MIEWLTNPFVITFLLTVAGIGIVFELFSHRFGLPGLIGMAALIIFFYGAFQAGYAGYGTIFLFAVGLILIFLEFFLPGAIAGTLGIAAILTSLLLAGGNASQMAISLSISILLTLVFFYSMVKIFGKKLRLFNRMVLFESARKEDGYVSNVNRTDLLGKKGIALTMLRPSGKAIFNKERVDVVSEGGFISKNTRIQVIKVEGARIVVREAENE